MHGTVHISVRDMVPQNHGTETLAQNRSATTVRNGYSQAIKSYDDSISLSLAEAASETLQITERKK
jgi:hypothetical protein